MRQLLMFVMVASLFAACKNDKKGTEATGTGADTATTTTTTPTNGGARVWDDQTRAAFITNCTDESKTRMDETAAREYCNCMLEKIVAKYPNPADANNMTIQETQDMARDCVK